MPAPLKTRVLFEFGRFSLDPSVPLLMRHGETVPLTPKALEILLVLVRNAGSVVDKDTLLRTVWPTTFVEEANVAQHISTLRKILNDGEGGPIPIETVPKRGYRFSAAVIEVSDDPKPFASSHAPPRLSAFALGLVALSALALVGLALRHDWTGPGPLPQLRERQITANPENNPVLRSALSPDGKYLAYTDKAGIHILVVDTGETRRLESQEHLCFR